MPVRIRPDSPPLSARRRSAWPLPVAACVALLLATAVAAAPYAGRPVGDVLRELQARGLSLIYNDRLIPPGLLVLDEPRATEDLALLEEILAPHGLGLRRAGAAAWSIVRAAAPPGAATAASRDGREPRPLEEIVVATSRYRLAEDDPEAHIFLTQEELRRLPRLADDSLRAVHRLPGAASNGLSGLAHIRGGEENETRIVFDGMPLYEPFHLKNLFSPVSVLDPGAVGSIDVHAGGFPVQFGGRMSAIVDVTSAQPPEHGCCELGVSLFHSGATAGGELAGGRGQWLLSGRRSNLDEIADLAGSELGEPRYLDAFARLGGELGAATSGALHVLVSQDEAEVNNSAETEFADVRYRNAWIWGTLHRDWSEDWSGRALAGYTAVDNERQGRVNEPGRRSGSVSDDRRYGIALLRLELMEGAGALTSRFGVEASRLDARYDYASQLELAPEAAVFERSPGSDARRTRVSPDGWEFGAWASSRWRVSPRLAVEGGLRWDEQTYDRVGGGVQLSPRVSALYAAAPGTRLRASWGRFYQAQGINELQVEDGIGSYFRAQRADHAILGLEHALGENLELRIEAYLKDYDRPRPRFENLLDPFVLLPELQVDRTGIAPERARVRGIEILLNHRADPGPAWWLSYTWSRATDRVDGQDIARTWDQTHTVNGGVGWVRGRWDLSVAGTWHTGWPTTAVFPVADGAELVPAPGPRNGERLGPFRSVDFRVNYTLPLARGELLAFLEVNNVFGFRNECCVSYAFDDTGGGGLVLRREVDHWPRFVPNLGVAWKF